ncbi:periplasmic divalent cation tolerance protein [Herbihabitans rhizosphaerae]|uniref:Periplasmic divalent cation tolerance protein n=1 Tax=Herbihabitans rhizosphaerae TaxID=1872711 RepID=A0A4Q7KM33_9PSEU|nr:divalent cation tolerance protein CutA [Herbihabitans rhizosphaerae]RZS37729.1 periplasmic divalent cation tolerance protein [Herbihabitans rhizosphaerae]
MSSDHVVATFTTDSKQLADTVAAEVLAAELGCPHIEGPIRSKYHWHGTAHADAEWRVEIATSPDRADALLDLIKNRHGVEVPDVALTGQHELLTEQTG